MAGTDNELLQRVYGLTGPEEAEKVYDEWARTYDADTTEGMGYVAPGLAATRLMELVSTPAVVLDAGCGTGLVGAELADRSGLTLDGIDLSPGMLDRARSHGVYRTLSTADMTKRLDIADAGYDAAICVGTLTGGHVGPDAFDELVRVVRRGGYVVATVHEYVWESGGYRAHLDAMVERGSIRLIEAIEQPYHERENIFGRICVLEVL